MSFFGALEWAMRDWAGAGLALTFYLVGGLVLIPAGVGSVVEGAAPWSRARQKRREGGLEPAGFAPAEVASLAVGGSMFLIGICITAYGVGSALMGHG